MTTRKQVKKLLHTKILEPPKRLTVDEWAEQYRNLSPENAAEPGRYHFSRTPYWIEPAREFTNPLVKQITLMTSAQVGKTTLIENIIGYIITVDPFSILMVLPTVEKAEEFSRERFAKMVRDTKCLKDVLGDDRSKISGQTILVKDYIGGHIVFTGSNSAASLASRPIRFLFCDEIDLFAKSAGVMGDPITLAKERTQTFWNRKFVFASTPSLKGFSKIEKQFLESDQNHFWVPCPSCNTFQILKWGSRGGTFGVQWEEGKPETAYYQCAHCEYHIQDHEKLRMNLQGEWRASAPFTGNRGYHICSLYSPFTTFSDLAADYIKTAKLPDQLKGFINGKLGETWEIQDKPEIELDTLNTRTEDYGPNSLPDEIGVLTAGVDVQGDRIEIEVVGWGSKYESWGVEKKIFYGPTAQPETWNQLKDFIDSEYETVSGRKLKIHTTCIDSGYNTKIVYNFVRPLYHKRVFATKGYSGAGRQPVTRPTSNNVEGVRLFTLGVDALKQTFTEYLKLEEIGPGYCHFPNQPNYDEEYFLQLTSEILITKTKNGHPYPVWKKIRERNESLDIRVYASAALEIGVANLENYVKRAIGNKPQPPEEPPLEQKPNKSSPFIQAARDQLIKSQRRKSFVHGWKKY